MDSTMIAVILCMFVAVFGGGGYAIAKRKKDKGNQ